MNSKSVILTGAVTLFLATLADAATQYVYLTGSTAARGSVYNAIGTAGVVFQAAPSIVTQGNATPSKCQYMNFSGQLVGDSSGTITVIKANWSGSEAGIADIAGSGTQQVLDDSAGSGATATGPFVSSSVDLAMADNDKAFSKNPTANITGVKVGIITFKWVKQKGSNVNIIGVTDPQLRAILTGGSPEALLTGNNNDVNYVYVTGRNSNSGTRVNAYGITGYGIFSSAHQIQVAADGSMVKNSNNGDFTDYLGDYGYESGGDVAKQMGYDLSLATSQDVIQGTLAHFSVIAYLGYNDASSAVSNGGTELSYNGLMESTALVQEGKYTYWGKEFLYHRNANPALSSQALSVYNRLSPAATGINHYADGSNLIDYTTMHADRTGPTSDPFHF